VSVRVASLVASAVCIFSVLAGASKAAEVRPAVDGVNSVVEVTGGSLSGTSLYGSGGILSIPLTGPYGLEITGGGGSLDGRGIGLAGANLFWRDPALARFGLVSNYLYWDSPIGAVNGYRVGGQAEGYFGRFTLGGAAGVTGHTAMDAWFGARSFNVPATYDFFEETRLDFYATDNLRLSVGQSYVNSENALTLGFEWGVPLKDRTTMAGLFVDASFQNGSSSYLGGIRFYFGQRDKTLIRRNREDDIQSPVSAAKSQLKAGIKSLCTSPIINTDNLRAGGVPIGVIQGIFREEFCD